MEFQASIISWQLSLRSDCEPSQSTCNCDSQPEYFFLTCIERKKLLCMPGGIYVGSFSLSRAFRRRRFRQEYEYNNSVRDLQDSQQSGKGIGENDADAFRSRNVRVCVRKRPFFQHEKEQGEYDVITAAQVAA